MDREDIIDNALNRAIELQDECLNYIQPRFAKKIDTAPCIVWCGKNMATHPEIENYPKQTNTSLNSITFVSEFGNRHLMTPNSASTLFKYGNRQSRVVRNANSVISEFENGRRIASDLAPDISEFGNGRQTASGLAPTVLQCENECGDHSFVWTLYEAHLHIIRLAMFGLKML